MFTRQLRLSAWVFFALLAPVAAHAAEETDRITGRVVDQDGKPVAGLELKLHEWDREYGPVPHVTRSGADGRFEFKNVKRGYPLILSQDPHFAIACQSISFEEGGTKEIEFHVAPGVRSSLLITDPEGHPLPGARMREFGINGPGNGKAYFRGLDFKLCDFPKPASGGKGVLQLPPLPAGTIISAIIEHDDWAATRRQDLRIKEGQIAIVSLQPGIKLRFDVAASSEFARELEGMELTVDLRSEPYDLESSLIRVPVTVHANKFHICARPGTYDTLRFDCDEAIVTPQRGRGTFQIGQDQHESFSLLIQPAVEVRGRVIDAGSEKPLQGKELLIETQNLAPDGTIVLDGTQPWALIGWAETDADGGFVAKLPPGAARVSLRSEGLVSEQDYYEIDVRPDEVNRFADIAASKPPVIYGRVVDRDGHPLSGAVVRFGSRSLRYVQPIRSDEAGNFKLAVPSIPINWETSERLYDHKVVAFMPHDRRAGLADIGLKTAGTSIDVTITLEDHDPGWLFETLSAEMTAWEQGKPPETSRSKMNPQMQPGKVPPELDCREWLNSEDGKRSLADFRGKYIFLDFSTVWCGPCRGDEPSVKLLHQLYGDRVAVIGVHDNSVPIDEIRQYIAEHKIPWPVAVDHEDGRTLRAFEEVGVLGYPSYILLNPEGKLITYDRTVPGPTLRNYKLERVRQLLLKQP